MPFVESPAAPTVGFFALLVIVKGYRRRLRTSKTQAAPFKTALDQSAVFGELLASHAAIRILFEPSGSRSTATAPLSSSSSIATRNMLVVHSSTSPYTPANSAGASCQETSRF